MKSRPVLVLIVEDDADQRDMYAEYLAASGMRVLCASDGPTGIQRARAANPDVIVLDMHLPRMDGLAVLKALRADSAVRRIPVVVLSGDGIILANEAVSEGCRASLQKPCLPRDLEGVVSSLVDEAAAAGVGCAPT
jgi:CheY-like chemotaxis protein